ncbi:unnamed protein product [Gordionus sp. m RMFG-2023]
MLKLNGEIVDYNECSNCSESQDLKKDLLESQGLSIINLPHIDYDSFLIFIRYVYKYEIEIDETNIIPLLYLSKKYMMKNLTKICINYIILTFNPHNICKYLILANMFDEYNLREECLEFISQNIIHVITSGDFDLFNEEELSHILCYKVVQNEMWNTFKWLLPWGNSNFCNTAFHLNSCYEYEYEENKITLKNGSLLPDRKTFLAKIFYIIGLLTVRHQAIFSGGKIEMPGNIFNRNDIYDLLKTYVTLFGDFDDYFATSKKNSPQESMGFNKCNKYHSAKVYRDGVPISWLQNDIIHVKFCVPFKIFLDGVIFEFETNNDTTFCTIPSYKSFLALKLFCRYFDKYFNIYEQCNNLISSATKDLALQGVSTPIDSKFKGMKEINFDYKIPILPLRTYILFFKFDGSASVKINEEDLQAHLDESYHYGLSFCKKCIREKLDNLQITLKFRKVFEIS